MIDRISSFELPRQIITEHFKLPLPISGGWGYTKDDVVIIVKPKIDPIVNKSMPFDGIGIEYVFVEKRIYEELIIFRPEGERFSDISWKLLRQELIERESDDRVYDKLTFEITALPNNDFEELKAEGKGPEGFKNPSFDIEAHEKKREERTLRYVREYWFDITSFYGQGISC